MKKFLSITTIAIIIIMALTACTASKRYELNEELEQFENLTQVYESNDWRQPHEPDDNYPDEPDFDIVNEPQDDTNTPKHNPLPPNNFVDILELAEKGINVYDFTFHIHAINTLPLGGNGTPEDPYLIPVSKCKLNKDVTLDVKFFEYTHEDVSYLITEDYSKIFVWNMDGNFPEGYLNVEEIDESEINNVDIENAENFFIIEA